MLHLSKPKQKLALFIGGLIIGLLLYGGYRYVAPYYAAPPVESRDARQGKPDMEFYAAGLSTLKEFAVKAGAKAVCPEILKEADILAKKSEYASRFNEPDRAEEYGQQAMRLYQKAEALAKDAAAK